MQRRKKSRMRKRFLAFFMLTIAANASWAQNAQCTLSGWVEDKDKQGTNVRATPSAMGKVVTVFPFPSEDGDQAMVEIIGYDKGWLKISSAETIDGSRLLNETAWISAKKVTASVETNNNRPATLYSKPKRSSPKAGTIPNNTMISITGFDCFGYKVSHKGKSGWISRDDVCGNPVTTCP
jgi:hypothetical protein